MKQIKKLFLIFLAFTFLAGILVILTPRNVIETIANESSNSQECPNLLIQKDGALLLYNTNLPTDETNPIPFQDLDEYIYYLELQRKIGKNCPVLYLQQENNAQGQDVYRIRPNPFDLQGGLPAIQNVPTVPSKPPTVMKAIDATRDNPPYNKGNYDSYDPYGQYVGIYTNIDVVHDSTKKAALSDNPMDVNWGGVDYTQKAVDTGKYEGNEIYKPKLYQPKMAFLPLDNKDLGQPKDVY